MADPVSRRIVLTRCGATVVASALGGLSLSALATGTARAQGRRILGVQLPQEVINLMPAQSTDILLTVERLIGLEREADRRGLPRSILQVGTGGAFPEMPTLATLYQTALPRLVALIDRAERRDRGFADQAGALLAQLHGDQHEVPQGLLLGLSGDAAGDASADLLPPPVVPGDDAGVTDSPTMTPPDIALPDLPGLALPDINLPGAPSPADNAPTAAPPPLSRAIRYPQLRDEYARLFSTATLRPERDEPAQWHLTMMRRSRARYEAVAAQTGVPWYFIAATHGLEASFNFRAHLHNGDFPLSARTRQVPAGRPTRWLPPSDWESSAVDALRVLGFTGQSDWSLERTLHRFEAYNGFGYRNRGVPTPYLWSFSNHYERGKFVADGRWNPTARSQQCGAAVMLKLLVDAGEVALSPGD